MNVTRMCCLLVAVIILGGCSRQASHQREQIVAEAVDRFHQQVNEGRYDEVYGSAHSELRENTTEAKFVEQLKTAHSQIGSFSGKASVFLRDGLLKSISRSLGGKDLAIHVGLASSDSVFANERFIFELAEGKASLVSYQFNFICNRPCVVGIGTK